MDDNSTIFQSFEWNLPSDRRHYQRLTRNLSLLHSLGINALWLPPACKAGNSAGNGYDIYDLYDLGEFDQRGSRATKWGSKEDLVALTAKAKELGVDLYFDAVLNHRCGGDAKEIVRAVEVDPNDRKMNLGQPKEVEAWLRFYFAGRRGQYSTMQYNWRMFNGSDWDDRSKKPSIYRIVDEGKCWATDVSKEWGNGDYLMFNNLDYTNKELRDDVKNWGVWVTEQLDLAGFRLDAMQHFSQRFSSDWIKHVQQKFDREIFVLGEYWNGDVDTLTNYLKDSPPNLYLYDAPLLYNLHHLSWSKTPDLRTIFDRTLVKARPNNAVTLVMNHDTQQGQTMDAPIHPTFTSLAYALILLRQAGRPCVFYGDMYGISKPFLSPPTCYGKLADLILARKLYAYGEQEDYFEDSSCIGWVRRGLPESDGCKIAGMAVVMSWVGEDVRTPHNERTAAKRPSWLEWLSILTTKFSIVQGSLQQETLHQWSSHQYQKRMNVGAQHTGEEWTNILGESLEKVVIAHDGKGLFPCQRNSVAIYISDSAEGRGRFPVNFKANIYR